MPMLTKGKVSARGGDLGKSALEEQFGFTIDTAQAAKMIEANGYVTYTMLIKRDSVSNAFFENLLITVDSVDQKAAYTVKYNLTSPIVIDEDGAYYFNSTKELTTLYDERMNFSWLDCRNVVFPMCDRHGGSYNYDHVFMGWDTCTISYYHSEWICTIPGVPENEGGGTPPPPPPVESGNNNGPGSPVTIPLPELANPDNCQMVNMLSKDSGFRGRLNNLKIAAQPPANAELLYTVYPKVNVTNSLDKFNYMDYQGPPNSTEVTFPFLPDYSGFIHCHYSGLLSIFSPQDLRRLYHIVTDNIYSLNSSVFMGVVNSNGTAYIIQIDNVNEFVIFGNKELNKDADFASFETEKFNKKFNILNGNSESANEKNFIKMMSKLKIGINIYKASHPYNQFQKLKLVNEEVALENCN